MQPHSKINRFNNIFNKVQFLIGWRWAWSVAVGWQLTLLNNFKMRENYNPSWLARIHSRRQSRNTSIQRKQERLSPARSFQEGKEQMARFELPRENVMQAVSIVQWRCQTSLPILRVAHYEVSPLAVPRQQRTTFRSPSPARMSHSTSLSAPKMSIKISQYVSAHPEIGSYQLRIQAEGVRLRLSDAGSVPFSQALHLLREMLIGCEALFDIFGPFQPSEALVAVNLKDQWRMWIDQDFCSSFKKEANITEREFIYRVILMIQKHSLQTVQSRLFFGAAKESTYSNDCSFIKVMQKLKNFIDVNRIYIPSKVSILKEGQTAPNSKLSLQKIEGVPVRGAPFGKRKESSHRFSIYSKSSLNLNKIRNGCRMRSYPSCTELKHPILYTPKAPSSPILGERSTLTFQMSCDNWANQHDASISSITLLPSPKKQNTAFLHHSRGLLNQRQTLTSAQSMPVFNLCKPMHFSKKEELQKSINLQRKPASQLNDHAKRANIRKYSEQLGKLKSADNLVHKKLQVSTVSHSFLQPQLPQKSPKLPPQPSEQALKTSPKVSRQQSATKQQAGKRSSSSHGLIPSSPNNSSSTKEIGTSGEMEEAYRSLKMQDLAPHRKNNQSLIHHHLPDSHHKNMTVSYQFKRPDPHSDSESGHSSPHPPQWVNKISDLFSDTVSIKQLKGSIRFKGQEEVFEKEHLKDVKLDMLQKFGRSVTLQVQEEDAPSRSIPKYYQYKSMQLIEEELQQVKSYQDDDRQEDAARSIRSIISIRSIRSRRQTQQTINDRERQISFKDEFLLSPQPRPNPQSLFEQAECGFDFQTQMYSIRGQK